MAINDVTNAVNSKGEEGRVGNVNKRAVPLCTWDGQWIFYLMGNGSGLLSALHIVNALPLLLEGKPIVR